MRRNGTGQPSRRRSVSLRVIFASVLSRTADGPIYARGIPALRLSRGRDADVRVDPSIALDLSIAEHLRKRIAPSRPTLSRDEDCYSLNRSAHGEKKFRRVRCLLPFGIVRARNCFEYMKFIKFKEIVFFFGVYT